MHQPLNIPLESTTTRRRNWRVVWLILVFFLSFCCAILANQLIHSIDSTSTLRPETTEFTIFIQLTPKNRQIIEEHLGSEQILAGLPWTWHDAISWSKDEISIHVGKQGIIAFSTDDSLPKNALTTANSFETFILNDKDSEPKGLSLVPTRDPLQQKQIITGLVLPRRNGYVIWNDGSRNMLTIAENRVILHGSGLPGTIHRISTQENTETLAQLHLSNDIFAPILVANGSNQSWFPLSDATDLFLTISHDQSELVYYLLFQNSTANLDELTRLGNEIMNIHSLSTASWTINDGTRISEIVADKDAVESNLSTNNGITTLEFTSTMNDYIRIIQSDETISMSNRKTILNSNDNSTESSCANTQQFIKPRELFSSLEHIGLSVNTNSLFQFSEIAFKKKSTYFCWE